MNVRKVTIFDLHKRLGAEPNSDVKTLKSNFMRLDNELLEKQDTISDAAELKIIATQRKELEDAFLKLSIPEHRMDFLRAKGIREALDNKLPSDITDYVFKF